MGHRLLPRALFAVITAAGLSLAQSGTQHALPGRLMNKDYPRLPLSFEMNRGQTDPQVQFFSHGNGYSAYLRSGSLVLVLRSSEVTSTANVPALGLVPGQRPLVDPVRRQERAARAQKASRATFSVNLVGGSPNPSVVGEEPLPTKINYFIGRDASKWRRNVPTYRKIRYRSVYSGIDLVYYGNNHDVEYDFDLAAGADATKIQFSVNGADALNLDSANNLVVTKGTIRLLFQAPIVYQESDGKRLPVLGKYVMRDATHIGFAVGNYDATKPLVIDPVLVYSTFLGGSGDDFSNGIAMDSAGNAYVIGITDSPNFPLATIGSYNATQFVNFLAKFDSSGSTLLFADYFGGTSGGDEASAIALDSSGNAYVTGCTTSSDFPVVNAYQSTLAGSQDAFVTKFSGDGSSLIYSTYLGGPSLQFSGGSTTQYGTSISVDPEGEAVVGGVTMATDFPTTANAYQSSVSADQFGDWGEYGFVTKLAPDGASLVYSTYLAGNLFNTDSTAGCLPACFPDSEVFGVATDGSGNAYVTGITTTSNFPVTSAAFDTTYPGYPMSDVGFVSKFTNAGAIAYSTYLGGFLSSLLMAIAVDTNGSAYVTGHAYADENFPTVGTSICDPSAVACNGAVIVKLDPTGSSLIYSTFLGTANNMVGQAIRVDANGDAFIVGSDVGFDLSNPIEGFAGGAANLVVAEVDPAARTLLMATFLGGTVWDAASGLALDSNGAVYVTGETQSPDFPVTQASFQSGFAGQADAFISKIDPVTVAPAVAMGPYSLQFTAQNVGTTSAPQTSILRNMGSAALTINSITMSGDFAESNDCGATVAPASYCTLQIVFTPTASGSRTGVVVVDDDAQGNPHSLTLSGTGVGAVQNVTISPSSLIFPPTPVGSTSAPQVVTFTNTGSTTVTVSAAQVSGDFTVLTNTCATLASYGNCTVRVGFIPSSTGVLSGAMAFVDSASASPQVVPLSGSGEDFVTSPVNTSASVAPGGIATYTLNISPTGGAFSSLVNLACNGAPAFATCSVNPNSITPGPSSVTATVTVKTSGPTAQMQGISEPRRTLLALWTCMPLAFFGVFLLSGNRRGKFAPFATSAVMVLALLLFGCGGTGIKSISNTTPAGTYTFSVVASAGQLQHATQLTLTVR